MTRQFERILLTRLKYIGDIVLTTPLIHTLRDRFPKAYIAYLGDKNGVSLLEQNPYLDEIFSIDLNRNTALQQLQLFYRLNRKRFDLVVDLFCNPRSALLSYATQAPVRVGGDLPGRGQLYTVRIKDDGIPKSAVEFHYQSLKAVGIEPKYFAPEIFLTDDEKKESRRYLEWQGIDFSKPIVALHPGGTWPAKLWPAARFADLADLLIAKTHAHIVLTSGPQDTEVAGAVENAVIGGVLSLPVLPLRQLAAILSLCTVCLLQMIQVQCTLPPPSERQRSGFWPRGRKYMVPVYGSVHRRIAEACHSSKGCAVSSVPSQFL